MLEFKKETINTLYDLIIVGAGPAGMTAAVYASRGGLSVLMIDSLPGGKLNETSEVENWPGETSVLGPDLAQKMAVHSTHFGAQLEYAQVEKITVAPDGTKLVETFNKVYRSKTVLIATGTVERKLGIPGEQEYYGKGVSYCAVCDAAFFRGEKVIVIGGGNSAYDASDYLSRFAKEVHQFLRRDVPRAEQIIQDRVAAKDNITLHFSYSPIEIRGTNGKVSSVLFRNNKDKEAEPIEVEAKAIFPQIGVNPNTDFVKNLDILDDKGYIIVDENLETKIPGIFAAGDVIPKKLRQIVTATNDGAIAGEAISAYVINELSA